MLKSEHPFPNSIAIMEKVLSPAAMFKFNCAFDKSIRSDDIGPKVRADKKTLWPSTILLEAFHWTIVRERDGVYWAAIRDSLIEGEIMDGLYAPDMALLAKLSEA